MGTSTTRGECERCVAEPLRAITAIVPGSKWSCSLLRIVLQDALGAVTNIYPRLKLRVFVDDITALLMGKKRSDGNGKECDEEVAIII